MKPVEFGLKYNEKTKTITITGTKLKFAWAERAQAGKVANALEEAYDQGREHGEFHRE